MPDTNWWGGQFCHGYFLRIKRRSGRGTVDADGDPIIGGDSLKSIRVIGTPGLILADVEIRAEDVVGPAIAGTRVRQLCHARHMLLSLFPVGTPVSAFHLGP
jgi:hypothetical protein